MLDLSRPYRPGDWIGIEGTTDGRIIEINWCATNVLTAKRDLAVVPNRTIARANIVNASSPFTVHGTTVIVLLETDTPPARAKEVLEIGARNCRTILTNPSPSDVAKSINARFIEFDKASLVGHMGVAGQRADYIAAQLQAFRNDQ